ncbi:hypothetical protein [Aromatoleum buckelii]|uniref:Uncharacterized protein n=1 Tax=Aromatoleum buckelii TaxID=200254 RepID=A0ABX1N160_9RHOO|nr:hypothetical protein [Aromatoleum buckelii]MCK0510169.1 hypothetical protein [Aromatoleum buckelii]
MARKHWTEWLPNKVAELKEEGQWEISLQIAGKQAFEMVLELMQQGFQQHEAEEVALKEFVLLPPEPPDENDREAKETAALEVTHHQGRCMNQTCQRGESVGAGREVQSSRTAL